VRAGADPWSASRPAAAAAVPAIPPSRSGKLQTSGRSSDSRARAIARLLAAPATPEGMTWRQWPECDRPLSRTWAFPGPKIARTQRRGRPGFAPEFPVCRRKAAAFSRPPESHRSVPIGRRLSTVRGHPAKAARSAMGRRSTGKPCGSCGLPARSSDGCTGPRRRRPTGGAHGSLCPTRTLPGPRKKTLNTAQAVAPPPPIAPMTPGASLCPSGNQGAAVTCDFSSHGMARQACRNEFVNHNLGVKASRAGRAHR